MEDNETPVASIPEGGSGTEGTSTPAPEPTMEELRAQLAETSRKLGDLTRENQGLTRRIIKQQAEPPWVADLKGDVAALKQRQDVLAELALRDDEETELRPKTRREMYQEMVASSQPRQAPAPQAKPAEQWTREQERAGAGMRAFARAKQLDVNKLPPELASQMEEVSGMFFGGDPEGAEERFTEMVDNFLKEQKEKTESDRRADQARRQAKAGNMQPSGLQGSGSGTPDLDTLRARPVHNMTLEELEQHKKQLYAALGMKQ